MSRQISSRPRMQRLTMTMLLLGSLGFLGACEDASSIGLGAKKSDGVNAAQVNGIHGLVLDMSGKPAVGVPVQGTLLSNSSGNLLSNSGGNLLSNSGGNLLSNGGSLFRISGGFQTQSGFKTTTDKDGKFSFNTSDDQVLTLEAIQQEGIKAIQLDASASGEPFTLQLAPTGHIQGTVLPADAAITDLLNIDVFIPGTSYIAKTDDKGHFTLSNVPRGSFTLVADHRDLGRAVLQGVAVVSNQTTQPPALQLSTHTPVLSGIAPANGAPGTLVTLAGEHFGVSSGKRPEVLLNGISAQVVSATDTQIKALIPLGSVSGTVRVSVSGLESVTKPFQVLRSLALFPDYREADASNPTAQPPTADVLAMGASRHYHVRAFDTEGRLVSSPAVSWNTLGNDGSGLVDGTLTPTAVGHLAIAAVSGSLSTPPLAIEIVPAVKGNGGGIGLLAQVPVLSPLPPNSVPAAERSTIPDSFQLQPRVLFENNTNRELPVLYESLDARLTVTASGLVSVKQGAESGSPKIRIIPIADPSKFRELVIPVQRQGDLSFIIE